MPPSSDGTGPVRLFNLSDKTRSAVRLPKVDCGMSPRRLEPGNLSWITRLDSHVTPFQEVHGSLFGSHWMFTPKDALKASRADMSEFRSCVRIGAMKRENASSSSRSARMGTGPTWQWPDAIVSTHICMYLHCLLIKPCLKDSFVLERKYEITNRRERERDEDFLLVWLIRVLVLHARLIWMGWIMILICGTHYANIPLYPLH